MLWLFAGIGNAAPPRIVNIVNFVRQNDYRIENSEERLLEATREELNLVERYDLPATFLLQYDALADGKYQKLFAEKRKNIEIGAWWEITQPQVEAAGLTWRGKHPWVSNANIAFTTGYTQKERKALVDVYMTLFKKVFGSYPKSVGSWFIDAWTLNYMYEKYHIVASCNCKDQIGTDGYTLWGGYWNQAYYPSKRNGYMPAQTVKGQIPVPVFRMLGSDPIYQYDSGLGTNGQGVTTLEPVYAHAGGSRQWTEAFFDAIANQPCLAFSYTQAGQENSFTWDEIKNGLEMQIPIIADLFRQGKINVKTLEQSGKWFRKNFKTTPATAVTAMKDTRNEGNKTVWYNSRYYRCNILIDKDGHLRFRDIHLFDEALPSQYYDSPGQTSRFSFETLPVVDGFKWSKPDTIAVLRLIKIGDVDDSELTFSDVNVKEYDSQTIELTAKDRHDNVISIKLLPEGITVSSTDKTDLWALELTAADTELPFTDISPRYVKAQYMGARYAVKAAKGFFQDKITTRPYVFRARPEKGEIALDCSNKPAEEEPLSLNGNRFLTLCFMIRTTPWEVSRDVKLHPRDEEKWHTLESVTALREAFAKYNPDGRLTWGFTLNALEDQRENYKQIRDYAVMCHNKYGDEISYFPGYFPVMYLPRERINKEMHEAINEITEMVGGGYRPQCIMGGFLSSDNLKYLAEKENIHVAHAVIWSQHAIDGGGAEGSISYPYYPSAQHFCKAAQGEDDFIDCVSLDGWTMDFICARRSGQNGHAITGYNSRRGVGPIETYWGWGLDLGQREVMHTEGIHYDKGYELNGFGWVTNIWETQMYHETGKEKVIPAMEQWIKETKEKWNNVKFITYGEFGELWRKTHKSNDFNYRFCERGSGLGDSYNNLELKWFMNKKFRMALLRDWHKRNSETFVIDFTRYDLPATEPDDASPEHPNKDWSLMNVLNQKQVRPQDKPKHFGELSADDRELILSVYPELKYLQ